VKVVFKTLHSYNMFASVKSLVNMCMVHHILLRILKRELKLCNFDPGYVHRQENHESACFIHTPK